ncbi:AcrR family transcriptional regulator [Azospirillum lipoferum]|uniref:TetR/AcrR family transcriptional regulator n=1 Tax=Azospirillum lipoferum TaxID=193 RepID=A0A5A9GV15_AZOLI|nr:MULTISPECIES: TetR/AcrR family transcriptional regulator [Azospirillum]KAA0598210.1 TetR/AcrR family transcriptional regulator [Azospirillum lipoferum]MCP1609810.1 AcrR family transcriptional regulator [Azospirillum lipoferum]MDW5534886.1 TetR/AcrR family transcriptional regulator [Azospirillum sp. NL1]
MPSRHPNPDPAPDGDPPRWRRRKDARPQEIVAAAMEVFAERGFAAARLEEVAARAGVSKGTLYLYFPSKEELFKAVIRAAILPNLEQAEAMVASAGGPCFPLLERLLRMVARLIATTRMAVIPRLVIAEAGNFPELAAFYHHEVIRRGFGVVSALLWRGIGSGEFRPMPVDPSVRLIVAPLLMSAVWRTSFDGVDGEPPLDVPALMEVHIDNLRRVLLRDTGDGAGAGDGAP